MGKRRPKKSRKAKPKKDRKIDRFATYFTTPNGRRIYAKDYGYEAWPIGQRK